MILTPNGKGLWVSTSESHVKYWDIQPAVDIHYSNVSTYNQQSPTHSLHHAQASVSNTNEQHLPQQQQGQILSRGVSLSPQLLEPELIISGGPSIKQYHVLNDKRHILTKDTDSHVALYDVLKAQRVEDLGQVDFDQETKNRGQVSLKFP